MQTKKIKVNRTEQSPEGVEIEVVEPEGDLEVQTLAYLLEGHVRNAKAAGILKMDLPEAFVLKYQSEGSFLMMAAAGAGGGSPYYAPPRPVAVLAIQKAGNRFDLAYAELKQSAFSTNPDGKKDEAKKPEPAKAGA